MTLPSNKALTISLFSLLFLVNQDTFAYKVKDISGKKILIDLEGEKLFTNDTILSINKTADGPEIAGSAKVIQVRDKQAVAIISDGKFIIGKKVARKAAEKKSTSKIAKTNDLESTSVVSAKTKPEPEYAEDEEIYETSEQRRFRIKNSAEDGIVFRKDMIKVSILGSFAYDKISAKQADDTLPFAVEETVPMSGAGSGLGLAFDYPSRWGVTLRTVLLNEKLTVSGQSVDDNVCAAKTSSNCMAQIIYLSAGEHLRFDLNLSRFTFWAAAGFAFKFPLAQSTTALRQEDIRVANAIVASAGLDFAFNNRFFLPISAEYHYSLNKSDSVPIIDHSSFLIGFGAKF